MIDPVEHFQQKLQVDLEKHIRDWKTHKGLGVNGRTIIRWINGENFPNELAFSEFLEKASQINRNFPKAELEELYKLALETNGSEELQLQEKMGADAYQIKFDEWCESAISEICVFQNWMSYTPKFPENLIGAVQRGISVKVLLLDPDSKFVDERYKERERTKAELLGYLEDLHKTLEKKALYEKSNFEMRFYNAIPPFAAYIVDSNILLAQYWYRQATSTGPHLVIDKKSRYGTFIYNTVEDIWNDPETKKESLNTFYEGLYCKIIESLRIEGKC